MLNYPITERVSLAQSKDTISASVQGTEANQLLRNNKGWRGFKLFCAPKTGFTGTAAVSISELDDSGNVIKVYGTGAIAAGSTGLCEVYPGLTAAGNIYNDILGYKFRVDITLSSSGGKLDATLDLIP